MITRQVNFFLDVYFELCPTYKRKICGAKLIVFFCSFGHKFIFLWNHKIYQKFFKLQKKINFSKLWSTSSLEAKMTAWSTNCSKVTSQNKGTSDLKCESGPKDAGHKIQNINSILLGSLLNKINDTDNYRCTFFKYQQKTRV